MAKRTRGVGVRNTHRPGGGAPVRQPAPRPTMGRGAEPPAAIPGEPLKPIAQDPVSSAIEAGAVAASAVAVGAAQPASAVAAAPVRTHHRGRIKVKEGSLLAERSQDEYAYIAKDLRHIAIVAVALLGVLIVLWLFFTQVDPFGLY